MAQEFFRSIWQNSTEAPLVLWAVLILFSGFFVSKWMKALTIAFFNKIRLNQVLKRMGLDEALSKIDTRLNAPQFLGEMVKWFFVILFLAAASEILGLNQLNQVLEIVIGYFPNIFISALIFIVAAFLADFSQKIVVGTLEKEKIIYSRLLGRSIRWAIWLFAILAILYQLKIASTFVLVVFVGMVAVWAIALGIAFGLGGKDLAAKILKDLEEKFR